MKKLNKIDKKALFSFIIFITCILKYYLFNVIQIYPIYGNINGLVSWLIILPLLLIGLFFSFKIIFKSVIDFRNNIGNLLLSIPLIVFVISMFFFNGNG